MQQLPAAISATGAADELLATMPELMRFMRGQMRRRRGDRLTIPQFRALIFVKHHPQATQSALAEHIGISYAAASRMVSMLARHRLLVRKIHPHDRRAVALGLTARGQARVDAAWNGMRSELAARLAQLQPLHLAGIAHALGRLRMLFADTPTPVVRPLVRLKSGRSAGHKGTRA